MKKWIIKAIVQKGISWMPMSQSVNYLFQKYVTKGVLLTDDYFEDKLIHINSHTSAFLDRKESLNNITCLELGTGWYPTVLIGYYICGAGKIYSADINNLCSFANVKATIERYMNYHQSGKLDEFLTHYKKERIEQLKTFLEKADALSKTELLALMNIELIVGDTRNLPFQDDTFDLITSNNTFEHVHEPVLRGILREFKRVAKRHSIMSHFIDMSDHFAHMDSTINIYNFLQFSEKQWNMIDNNVQPQNRLRIPHYRSMYKQIGIEISEEKNRPGDLKALNEIKLAEHLAQFPPEELAISHSLVISEM